MNVIPEWQDAFGKQIADATKNDSDLGAHYTFSPERYRFRRNDSRVLLQYEDIDAYQYFDDRDPGNEDVFVLRPDPGDTLKFYTAERFRYTVGYVADVTMAVVLNQSLTNPNDRLVVAFDTSRTEFSPLDDGYFMEHLPEHDDDEVNLYEKRLGNVIGSKNTIQLRRPLTEFTRPKLDYNWYNVGIERWIQTYTERQNNGSKQKNKLVGSTSTQVGDANAGLGGRGPISGNGHVTIFLQADEATTGLEAHVGSFSYSTQGNVVDTFRGKGAEVEDINITAQDTYVPLFAVRVDPNRSLHPVQIPHMEITAGPNGKIMAIACDPSNVLKAGPTTLDDSDFSTPDSHSRQNSALEATDPGVVTQFPDEDGNTVTSTTSPGGYQVGLAIKRTTNQGQSQSRAGAREKHGIFDGDYIVFIGKFDNTNSNVYAWFDSEQDW